MKKMNYVYTIIASVFFVHTAMANSSLPSPQNSTLPSPTTSVENLNGVVAVVNNEIITQDEFNAAMSQASQQMAAEQTPNAIDQSKLKQMVLNQLIDEKLQLQLAKQADISISDAQVTQAIQRIAKGNHLTVAQLKQQLTQEGMSYSAYRAMLRKQLIIHQVEQHAIGSTVNVTDQDIQKARAQYQAQMSSQQTFHIIDLIATSQQQAKTFVTRLKKGEDINSIAPDQTKDLGWQTANTLPSIFLQQLSHMQTGDVSSIIQAPNGYHIIKLAGVRGNAATLSATQLRNYAYQMKFQQAVKKWIKTVRKTAYIKITQ